MPANIFGPPEKFLQNLPEWDKLVKTMCSFRNVTWIQYLDMRWNFTNTFKPKWDYYKEAILNNAFDFNEFYWGKERGWHLFDGKKDLKNISGPCYSEATFYD